MFGRHASAAVPPSWLPRCGWGRSRRVVDTEPALELEGVTVEPGMGEIGARTSRSWCWRARSWASRAWTGTASASWPRRSPGSTSARAGDVRLFGHSIGEVKVAQREKLGLRYVTDDRIHEGTVGSLSVAMNIVLKRSASPVLGARPDPLRAAILSRRAS